MVMMFRMGVIRRTPVLLVVSVLPWLALLTWLAAVAWFLCDDAFISFRYARNLIEGHGLVFNPGERVEGYSNLLWVLELAVLWGLLGLRPEQVAPWLSVVCTGCTIATVLWWITHAPGLQHRRLTAWMALGLLCSSATFAVWTSGGGLETRQFTLFVVLAVVCLTAHGDRPWGLLAASLSLAAGAYTRPEGPLLAACCFGWLVVHRSVASGQPRLYRRDLAWLVAPFIILVAAQFLFRYTYYGEWLPNTYYAKHVRPWYESGFRYLWAAAMETGLYLLLPLAVLALRQSWGRRRDLRYALPLLCVALHMAYVFRIGGDHFEYRPLDFYWPLLVVPAAVGVVHLGSAISDGLRSVRRSVPAWASPGTSVCAVALFIPVLFYASTLQGMLLFKAAEMHTSVDLDDGNAGWLLAAPGMPMLVSVSNDLRRQMLRQAVAERFVLHREYANTRIREWKDYDRMVRGVIPEDALMAAPGIGISFYYLPDLRVVDVLGLTDATVARYPVTIPNEQRRIAHDRNPPPGYLEERGVNIQVYPAASSVLQALRRAEYAVPVGVDLWMPFDSTDRDWVVARFKQWNLVQRSEFPGSLF